MSTRLQKNKRNIHKLTVMSPVKSTPTWPSHKVLPAVIRKHLPKGQALWHTYNPSPRDGMPELAGCSVQSNWLAPDSVRDPILKIRWRWAEEDA